jgi:hypothetical protein
MIVHRLGKIYGRPIGENLQDLYQFAAGRRTDEDIDKAYEQIVRYDARDSMHTPAQFRQAYGIRQSVS